MLLLITVFEAIEKLFISIYMICLHDLIYIYILIDPNKKKIPIKILNNQKKLRYALSALNLPS